MAGRAATAVKTKPKATKKTATAKTATAKTVAAKTATAKTATAKTAAGTTTAVAKPRRKAKAESRTRIYWAVFNQNVKRVALYEFNQRDEAEKRAEKLTSSSGEDHFIQKLKVAVE